ncbi:MAG: recombinase family protein [Candidatus Gastranaerophilales bacterium]|nr:recombinase family protein [Candidatus Gastranaerophilales bacterium]
MTNTAIGYRRVSSDEQKEKYSIPAQIEQQEKYASEKGFNLVKAWEVSESAKEPGRKGFNEMLAYAKKHRIGHILFKKADRSARNETDAATIVRLARTTDISFHFIEEGMVLNKDSKNHEFTIYMINCVIATLMPRDLAINVTSAFIKKAKMGHYPMVAPFGYTNFRKSKGETSHIIIDPDKAPFVKRIYELYASGLYSYRSLAKKMSDEGMRVSSGVKCAKKNVEMILNNPIYMGDFIFKGVRYEGKHEPIVSRELYTEVQRVIKNQTSTRANKRDFLFSGLFKCSHCGCSLVAELHKGKYIYYHCTGNKGGECKRKYISESKLEEGLIAILEKLKPSEETSKIVLAAIKRELKDNLDYGQNQAREIRKQIEATQKRLSNLLDLYTDGNIDKKSYDLKSKQWQYELDELLVLQTKINKTPVNYIERARDVFELSKNAKEWYLQADYEKKRELIKLLHSNFLYDGSNPHYELNSVFKLLLDFSKNGKNVVEGT